MHGDQDQQTGMMISTSGLVSWMMWCEISQSELQKYSFEMDLDEAGKRLYGGEANAGVAFQIGHLKYTGILRCHWQILVNYVIYQV